MESIVAKYASDVLLEKLYDINRRTWRQWRMRGQGPRYTKVGARLVRYDLRDVEAWLAEYKRPPCEQKAA
jgi:predicted DNA-binding transcriptional regulator AlpA